MNGSQTIKPLTKKYRQACFARQVKKIYISWSVINIAELLEYGDFFISVFDIANTLSYTAPGSGFEVLGSGFEVLGSGFEVRGSAPPLA
jgi:hypothetical protein